MKKGATLKSEIQRIQGKTPPPAQYKRGWAEFYKLKFKINRDVLIPRPETELLVDEVLTVSKLLTSHSSLITILDVGTGSGCISISIAKNLSCSKIIAMDISKKALDVAQKNAKFHKALKQIIFLEADLLPNFKKTPDIIVANLPYIPSSRLKYIDPMVTEWEPKIALDGGEDGFELYRRMFAQMKEKNILPKYFICEIDETQGDLALQIAKYYFPDTRSEIKKDLAKKDRILIISL